MLRGVGAALLVAACAGEDSLPVTSPGCADPLAIALPDGSCLRAGLPPEGCAPGFVHDGGYGCEPILPSDACPAGLMAVPGESECRAVLPCGAGPWGDIPIDASAVYVDQSYAGGDSDGSASRPFTTIAAAVTAAPRGALIAVAAGTYQENVVLQDEPRRLWGVCPEKTAIVGTGPASGCPAAALCIANAGATEIRGLSLSGDAKGIAVSGSLDVVISAVWIHDTAEQGIYIANDLGPTALRIEDSLIESAHEVGVFVSAADAVIERTVVRGTLPSPDQRFGCGIDVQPYCTASSCDPAVRAHATLVTSVVERNHDVGLAVMGSDADIDGSVVRHTLPRASDGAFGRGIDIQTGCNLQGVCDASWRAGAHIRRSLIEGNHEAGVRVSGSDAIIETTVVRGTLPRASDMGAGRGINVQGCFAIDGCNAAARGNASVESSLIAHNHEIGLMVGGSDVTLTSSVVIGTRARAADQVSGRGMSVELACISPTVCDAAATATARVTRSLLTGNHESGLHASTSSVVVESSAIVDTRARADGRFGDGCSVASDYGPASAALTNVLIAESARAGLASFGANAALSSVRIRCAAFDLEGEYAFAFEDHGNNRCGCPSADAPCVAVSAGIEPPAPVAR